MSNESRPSNPGYNPDQVHAEPAPGDNFYQPLTDIASAKNKLSSLLSKVTPITDQDVFEAIADGFASIAERNFQAEAAEGQEAVPWYIADEVEFHSPGRGSVFMSYYQDPASENIPREEEAWIQYSRPVYYFRRDAAGRVSVLRNTNVSDANSQDTPYMMQAREKRNILGIVQQGLDSAPQNA